MLVMNKPQQDMTAADLMTTDVIHLHERMPLREAARLLLQNKIGGAPVVDSEGRCVGVFSAMDFLRLSEVRADPTRPTSPALPITCSFQRKHRTLEGKETTIRVRLNDLIKDGDISQNIEMQPGDTLIIPQSWF